MEAKCGALEPWLKTWVLARCRGHPTGSSSCSAGRALRSQASMSPAPMAVRCACSSEGPEGTRSNRPAFRVSWSPDGEEILFAVGYEFPGPTQRPDRLDSFGSEAVTDVTLHAIRPDGSGLREIALGSPIAVWEVAWSPDGAEIAVLGMSDKELFLVTLPRGASSRQDPGVRTRASRPRRAPRAGSLLGWFLVAADRNWPPHRNPGSVAGVGVPEPAENPGLVADCEILVAVRDTLAGDAMLLWGEGP